MIISASRRTDIPALYARWLINRVRAGHCRVVNPFNPRQVSNISLKPEDVDAVVFWTRHARPLLRWLPLLDELGYRYYFQYTITGYGRTLEPGVPPLETAVSTFRDLAEQLPRGAVIWRYDPILMGDAFPPQSHLERFSLIARQLEGRTSRVVTSLVHMYRKTERRLRAVFPRSGELSYDPAADPEVPELLSSLVRVAARHGMKVEACAQEQDWSALGIEKTRCVDDRVLSSLFGGEWPSSKDRGQRKQCECIPSKDIGAVNTCTFGCVYCYATLSQEIARRNLRRHDDRSPSLINY
jgi:DNA repair photolyase